MPGCGFGPVTLGKDAGGEGRAMRALLFLALRYPTIASQARQNDEEEVEEGCTAMK